MKASGRNLDEIVAKRAKRAKRPGLAAPSAIEGAAEVVAAGDGVIDGPPGDLMVGRGLWAHAEPMAAPSGGGSFGDLMVLERDRRPDRTGFDNGRRGR